MTDHPDEIKYHLGDRIDVGLWEAAENITSHSSTFTENDPLDRQVGGDHYKRFPIQPVEYIRKNELGWFEGNVVKYVTRHRFKNKRQDIEKAIHMLECILKEYDNGELK